MSDEHEIEELEFSGELVCPACSSEGEHVPLGPLGRRLHFRCRFCGIDFSVELAD